MYRRATASPPRGRNGKLYVGAGVPQGMGFLKHLVNGVVSLAISVAVTVKLADDDDGPWDLSEVALAVAVSAFLSGFFTSFFAGE